MRVGMGGCDVAGRRCDASVRTSVGKSLPQALNLSAQPVCLLPLSAQIVLILPLDRSEVAVHVGCRVCVESGGV